MENINATPQEIRDLAWAQAKVDCDKYIEQNLDGQDAFDCGFAWVNIYPKHKGNTKQGRAERKFLREMGLDLDYTGKRFNWWNPANCGFQNIGCKEAGAQGAAKVLRAFGFDAHADSRLD